MTRLFTPEHYETAEQFEVPGFADAWGMTCAEIALTLKRLDEANSLGGMSMDDLQGYHFMHYAAGRELVKESVEWILEGNDWNEEKVPGTKQRLKEVLNRDQLLEPVILGRIAVCEARVCEKFQEFTVEVPEQSGRPGQQRFEKFVEPREGVVALFAGRVTIDVFNSGATRYHKVHNGYTEIINTLMTHTDHIILKDESGSEFNFAAQSLSEGWQTRLVDISPLSGLDHPACD